MMSDAHAPLLPFILATLLLVAAMAVARLRRPWPLWIQLATGVVIFALLTVLVQRLLGSPLSPRYSAISSGKDVWEHAIEGGWWVLAAGVGVTVIRLLVVLEHRPRETQIVSDLVAGGIYIAALLAIVNFVFSVPIAGLLATSGVIAIVLGLALQNTLADVFSGIAVGIERPYKAGDLIWVEGNIEGHVVQVTWRSTHIATFQSTIAIVPNSVMAKARLINRSRPDPTRGDAIEIRLDAAASPELCLATLAAAVRAAMVPLAFPAPSPCRPRRRCPSRACMGTAPPMRSPIRSLPARRWIRPGPKYWGRSTATCAMRGSRLRSAAWRALANCGS
jgi:small-conductance mechanosensitive channel